MNKIPKEPHQLQTTAPKPFYKPSTTNKNKVRWQEARHVEKAAKAELQSVQFLISPLLAAQVNHAAVQAKRPLAEVHCLELGGGDGSKPRVFFQ